MKQVVSVLLLAISFIFSSCSKESITGSGSIVSKTLQVPPFTGVEAHYDIDAVLSSDPRQEVVVTGYENLLAILDLKVENGILKLKYNKDYNQIRRSNVRATIKVPALSKAGIYGSGDIEASGFKGGAAVTLGIYGSGKIRVANSDYNSAVLDIYGSGNIEAQGLSTKEAVVNVYGSGHSSLSVSGKLSARIYGSGDINYWGNAAVTISQNGSGRVIKR